MMSTGLRRGELLALRWQDVDLQVGLLQARQALERVRNHGATGHNKKTRLLFQEPKTVQMLLGHSRIATIFIATYPWSWRRVPQTG